MARVPTLVTDRLVLRPPSPGDLTDLIGLGSDPDVMRYIGQGHPQTATQAGFWLECMLADARHGFPNPASPIGLPGWLVVIERDTQAFVGMGALAMLPPHHIALIGEDLCGEPCVEVGYRFSPVYWGKGYASEVAASLVQYGFDRIGLSQIVGIADVRNLASNRVLEKAGLELRKTYELSGISINFRSVPRP